MRGAPDDAGLTTADVDGSLPMAMTDHVPGTAHHHVALGRPGLSG